MSLVARIATERCAYSTTTTMRSGGRRPGVSGGRLTNSPIADSLSPSYWLEAAGVEPTRPLLGGDLDCDVVVVGAGFTGLWTARELLVRQPGLRVVVLEAERAGFGASGRNGGWCVPELNASLDVLTDQFGGQAVRDLQAALCETVDEVRSALTEESIAAGFECSGQLLLARGRYQLPLLRALEREYQRAGLGGHFQWLSPAQVAERIRVTDVVAGLYGAVGATLDPGRAVRGLARAVERRGATIYERTPVLEVLPGRRPVAITAWGRVRAQVVVLALEAYLTRLPGFRRRLLPVYSLITLTEPLTQEQLERVGWMQRFCLGSMRLSVDYLARTEDRRILVGGRGAPYRYGSRIDAGNERHAPTHAALRARFREWFPDLAQEVAFSHAWGGVLGMPRDWIPQFGFDRLAGIAYAYGYTGHGVATANLAGRTLADLISGRASQLTRLPLVGHRSPAWEPEPLRWLGVRYVQGQLAQLDRRGARGGRPPSGRTVAERLAHL